jgi:hypothetical protein
MTMTDSHKSAMADGRKQGAVVRRYLEALEANKPQRGRKRTRESVEANMAEVQRTLADPSISAITRLEAVQRELDLTAELDALATPPPPIDDLEAEFIAHAGAYATRKGITRTAFRAVGVPSVVLTKAGINR